MYFVFKKLDTINSDILKWISVLFLDSTDKNVFSLLYLLFLKWEYDLYYHTEKDKINHIKRMLMLAMLICLKIVSDFSWAKKENA